MGERAYAESGMHKQKASGRNAGKTLYIILTTVQYCTVLYLLGFAKGDRGGGGNGK